MKRKKLAPRDPLKLMHWADCNYPPIDLHNELPAVLELIKEIRFLRKLNPVYTTGPTIIQDDFIKWINTTIWVVYATETKLQKKLCVSDGGRLVFRVIHGQEIIYEGLGMLQALEAYNKIKSVPNPKEVPKLDN